MGHHALGADCCQKTFLDRIMFLEMMNDVASNPAEHNGDQQCIHHAEEIPNYAQDSDVEMEHSMDSSRSRRGKFTKNSSQRASRTDDGTIFLINVVWEYRLARDPDERCHLVLFRNCAPLNGSTNL